MRTAPRLSKGLDLVPKGCLVVLTAVALTSCSSEPRTDAERLARGKEIVERMSATLGSKPTFSMTTREIRDEIRPNGEMRKVSITRETVVRRPDRLYFKTSGDQQREVWYDGVGLTIAMHGEKVFGQARMPETLDKALDALHERYGVAAPVADIVYSSPAKALLTATTTGGWVKRETVDGQDVDHVSFKDKGVNWEIWVARSGEPLPRKAVADFAEDKRLRRVELNFSDWNLAPEIASDRFTPKVPGDYEGIAVLQRARVLRNIPLDDTAPTGGTDKSGTDKK
jgi:hypothetical protein